MCPSNQADMPRRTNVPLPFGQLIKPASLYRDDFYRQYFVKKKLKAKLNNKIINKFLQWINSRIFFHSSMNMFITQSTWQKRLKSPYSHSYRTALQNLLVHALDFFLFKKLSKRQIKYDCSLGSFTDRHTKWSMVIPRVHTYSCFISQSLPLGVSSHTQKGKFSIKSDYQETLKVQKWSLHGLLWWLLLMLGLLCQMAVEHTVFLKSSF